MLSLLQNLRDTESENPRISPKIIEMSDLIKKRQREFSPLLSVDIHGENLEADPHEPLPTNRSKPESLRCRSSDRRVARSVAGVWVMRWILLVACIVGCGGTSPAPVQPAPQSAPQPVVAAKTREVQRSLQGQLFLTSMLLDLDSFRGTEEFRVKGFSQASKYHRWLSEMENVSARDDYSKFTKDERIAAGDLMGLGFRYMLNRNQEEDYTRFARGEVNRVLGK